MGHKRTEQRNEINEMNIWLRRFCLSQLGWNSLISLLFIVASPLWFKHKYPFGWYLWQPETDDLYSFVFIKFISTGFRHWKKGTSGNWCRLKRIKWSKNTKMAAVFWLFDSIRHKHISSLWLLHWLATVSRMTYQSDSHLLIIKRNFCEGRAKAKCNN